MSFGKSMFLAGLNQKITKEDLFVKRNHGIPPRNPCGKTLDDCRRRITEVGHVALTRAAAWPLWAPHVSLLLPCRFFTALRIASPPFIQVGLI